MDDSKFKELAEHEARTTQGVAGPMAISPALLNGAGIERAKLNQSPGRPKGARNLHAKHPSSIARAFAKAGLNWQADFADAIKRNRRDRIKLWLRLLPYLVTTTNKTIKVKKWKGKASKAALIALDALEGNDRRKAALDKLQAYDQELDI